MKRLTVWAPLLFLLLLCCSATPAHAQLPQCNTICGSGANCGEPCNDEGATPTTCGAWGSCNLQCGSFCSSSSSCYEGCYNGAGWTTCGGWGTCNSCGSVCGGSTPCAHQCLGGGGLTTCGGDSQSCAAECNSVCNGGASCDTPCSLNEYWFGVTCRQQPGWVSTYGPVLAHEVSFEGEGTELHDIKACGGFADSSCTAVFVGTCPISDKSNECCARHGRSCGLYVPQNEPSCQHWY